MPPYNYYPNYQNAYQPMPQYYPQYQPQVMPNTAVQTTNNTNVQNTTQSNTPPQTILWVNGEKEAAMFPVASNSAVALWDSSNPVIYLKQADASGKPTMRTYDLVERVEASQDDSIQQNIDMSQYAAKSDLAAVVSVVGGMKDDIDKIKDELGNLASQAVKRAVGAKSKPPVKKDDDEDDE